VEDLLNLRCCDLIDAADLDALTQDLQLDVFRWTKFAFFSFLLFVSYQTSNTRLSFLEGMEKVKRWCGAKFRNFVSSA